jgi:hypothetical protein
VCEVAALWLGLLQKRGWEHQSRRHDATSESGEGSEANAQELQPPASRAGYRVVTEKRSDTVVKTGTVIGQVSTREHTWAILQAGAAQPW